MPNRISFIPECHLDKALTLVVLMGQQELVEKKNGISQVDAKMKEAYARYGDSQRLVGLVDKDKKFFHNEYLATFQPDAAQPPIASAGFWLRRHPATPAQTLILLDPGIEAWVLAAARACQLDPAGYKLPDTPALLRDYAKNRSVHENKEVIGFLLEVRRRRPEPYRHLADCMSRLLAEDT